MHYFAAAAVDVVVVAVGLTFVEHEVSKIWTMWPSGQLTRHRQTQRDSVRKEMESKFGQKLCLSFLEKQGHK